MCPGDSYFDLDIGDGRIVRSDRPPPEVWAAIKRQKAAMDRGDPPGSGMTAADAVLLLAWLDEQEDKYPTPPRRADVSD